MWAMCTTSGCKNRGKPIDVGETTITDPETGETTTSEVYCGVCEHPITAALTEYQPDPVPPPDPAEEP